MTDQEFNRLKEYVKEKYGIDMARKRDVVDARLANVVKGHNFHTLTEYLDAVDKDYSGKMERELMNILTINHSFFMREQEHFEFLQERVLPYLKKKEEKSKDIGIWCGASATGEEPYNLAMIMKDFFGFEHRYWDTTILATDISTRALSHAVAGVYDAEAVAAIPEEWKRRYMKKKGPNQYQMTDELKKEVIFRSFNLMDPFPFKRKFHIVFLRNVMIYFDDATKVELLTKIYNNMEPGGYLFIGRTETLDRKKVPFQMIQPSIFRKAENAR